MHAQALQTLAFTVSVALIGPAFALFLILLIADTARPSSPDHRFEQQQVLLWKRRMRRWYAVLAVLASLIFVFAGLGCALGVWLGAN